MNTKIRVEYDFDKKEPYIQFQLDVQQNQSVEMLDQMLRHFIEESNNKPLTIMFPDDGRNSPELRIITDLKDNRQQGHLAGVFENWLADVLFRGAVKWNDGAKMNTLYSDVIAAVYDGLGLPHLKGMPTGNTRRLLKKGTRRWYFEHLPVVDRYNAFKNIDPNVDLDNDADNLLNAIDICFKCPLNETEEGRGYWLDVVEQFNKSDKE